MWAILTLMLVFVLLKDITMGWMLSGRSHGDSVKCLRTVHVQLILTEMAGFQSLQLLSWNKRHFSGSIHWYDSCYILFYYWSKWVIWNETQYVPFWKMLPYYLWTFLSWSPPHGDDCVDLLTLKCPQLKRLGYITGFSAFSSLISKH